MSTATFQPGDKVMVPLHGLCTVIDIEEQEILGDRHRFYVLRPHDEQGVLKIPIARATGVRAVLGAEEMQSMLETRIEDAAPVELRPFEVCKRWVELLKSGVVGSRRRVLWEARRIEGSRKLTAEEKRIVERVSSGLQAEVAFSMGVNASSAGRLLSRALRGRAGK